MNFDYIIQNFKESILHKDLDFYPEKNSLLFCSLNESFINSFRYCYGISKLCLIPKNKDEKYVIKIPYTGSCYSNSDYFYINEAENNKSKFEPFYCANSDSNSWDYCATEEARYQIAVKEGFEEFFAETKCIGFANEYPIYIQDRCIPLSEQKPNLLPSLNEKQRIIKKLFQGRLFQDYPCCISGDWIVDLYKYYGKRTTRNFINFLINQSWDDDLRDENVGYLNGRPIALDYSGFSEY